LAVAILTLPGCMTDAPPPAEPTQQQLALNPFDTPESRPEILLTGKLTGRLATDGRCVTVETASGPVTPLWPGGTELRRQGKQTFVVLPDERGTASFGQRMRLAGGSFPASERDRLASFARTDCPQVYFVVSNVDEE
jgi:hypothetical protein